MKDKIRNSIEYRVWGRYALFSDSLVRMGGERSSYLVPTYQALKGITEQIYWKPSLIWVVDSVRILTPIQTESTSIRPISYDGQPNTLSIYTYLVDQCSAFRAHCIGNAYRSEHYIIAVVG